MKRGRRFLALFLSLGILFTMLPTAFAVEAEESSIAGQYAILGLTISESEPNTASVQLIAESNCTLEVALFSAEGQMLWAGNTLVTGAADEQEARVTLPADRPEQFIAKAFLVDSASYAPLCGSYTADHTDAFTGTYAINALRVDDSGIVAMVSADDACTLSVQVLDEAGEAELDTTSFAIAESLENEEVTVGVSDFAFPDHFMVRAVLQDAQGNALCNPYTTLRYTSAYQKFEALTPESFPDNTVLDFGDCGFGVLVDDITVVSATASDGTYSFSASTAPQAGDVLLTDVDSVQTPIKVKSVKDNGNGSYTVVPDENVCLTDFYQVLKLDAFVDVGTAAQEDSAATLMTNDFNEGGFEPVKLSGEFKAGPLTVFGSAAVELKVTATYDSELWGDDYFEYETYTQLDGTLKATLTAGVDSEEFDEVPEISLFNAPVPIGTTGLTATLKASIPLNFKVEAGGVCEVHFYSKAGFSYNPHDGQQKISDKGANAEFRLDGGFEVSVGPKLAFKVGLGEMLAASVSGQAGVKAKGTLAGASSKPDHGCTACLDISISAFAEFKGELEYKITEILRGTLAELNLLGVEWGLGKAYYSVVNYDDSAFKGYPTFGWGACPNYKYLVTVQTTDTSGETVTGVPITVQATDESGITKTLGNGVSPYQLYLYYGGYTALANFESGTFGTDFNVVEGPKTVTVSEQVTLVSGTVTDADTDKPIEGARISTTLPGGTTRTAVSDASGSYALSMLPVGDYTFQISADTYQTETVIKTLDPGANNTMNVELHASTGTVTGTVTDSETGEPIDAASVGAWQDGKLVKAVLSAADGSYTLELKPGTYVLRTTATGYASRSVIGVLVAADKTTNQSFSLLSSFGTVNGIVKDESGTGISGAMVTAVQDGKEVTAGTDSDGSYTIDLKPGTYTLTASAAGYTSSSVNNFSVEKDVTVSYHFALSRSYGVIAGTVTDERTGSAISGATVTAVQNGEPVTAVTDSDGGYSMTVWTGTQTLTASATGYLTSAATAVTVSENTTARKDIQLKRSGLNWEIKDGVLTIYGSGPIPDYNGIEDVPWHNNTQTITKIVIEDGITAIGKNAFNNNLSPYTYYASVTEVSIADTVTSIGQEAFHRCTGLTKVNIPDSVTSIGSCAFEKCTSLPGVTIPGSVASIEGRTFADCTSLTSATILKGVTSIGKSAFYGCTSLVSVTIPGSVTSIGNDVFYGCTSLESADIPEGVTSIGSYAFYNCSKLTGVTLPSSVTSIGSYAFYNCSSLTGHLSLPKGMTSISCAAFWKCSGLTGVTIPEGVTSIDVGAFRDCTGLTNVNIPNGVTSIGDLGFYGCTGLTGSVTIPEGVTSIGLGMFLDCTSLTGASIPDSVTSVGAEMFKNCTSLTSVTMPAGLTLSSDMFKNCTAMTHVKLTGTEAMAEYTTSTYEYTPWYIGSYEGNEVSVEIADSVTSISDYAFYECTNLTGVNIPVNATYIGAYAFYKCTNLSSSVSIPDGVTSIGAFAFYNCARLPGSLTIPEGVTSIGDATFQGCSSLTGLTLPDSVTSIGTYVFSNCAGLTRMVIPKGVTSIAHSTFRNCTNLTSVTIPDGVTKIDEFAFNSCSSLTSVIIPDGVTSICWGAFNSCSSLTSVTIPGSVTSIEGYALPDNAGMTVYFGGTEAQWKALGYSLSNATICYNGG